MMGGAAKCRPPASWTASIDRSLALRGVEREGRTDDVELLAGRSHHAIGSGHETRGRGQRHAASVFEIIAGFAHRLLADDARPAYFLQPTERVGDAPMTRLQLHGLPPAIGQRDGIGPEEI